MILLYQYIFIVFQVYGVCCPSQPAASKMRPRNVDSVVIDSLDRKDEGVSPEAETTMIMDRQTGCGAGPFRPLNINEQKIVGGTVPLVSPTVHTRVTSFMNWIAKNPVGRH